LIQAEPRTLSSAGLNVLPVSAGEIIVSGRPEDELVAFALGPCIGLAVYDSVARVGAMAHINLPSSMAGVISTKEWGFADLAVPELFKRAYAAGAMPRRLRVTLAGGASIMDSQNFFQIGNKNYLAVKKVLWQLGILISAEAVGGSDWRTLRLAVGSGRVLIQTAAGVKEI